MFRFLRRVFIILILLIIVFFIFRLVKPEATNRFVDRVKTIPTTISSRFHREKKSSIVINGDTTSTKSNFEINNEWEDDSSTLYIEDTTETNEYIENWWNMEDLSRLEELNSELDKILQSWNNQTTSEEYVDSENNENLGEIVSWLINDNDLQITEITWSSLTTWFIVIDVEQPYEPENQSTTNTQTTTTNTNTQTSNTQNNTSTSTKNTNKTTQKRWDCGEWLTVQDCEDFARDFWNFN